MVFPYLQMWPTLVVQDMYIFMLEMKSNLMLSSRSASGYPNGVFFLLLLQSGAYFLFIYFSQLCPPFPKLKGKTKHKAAKLWTAVCWRWRRGGWVGVECHPDLSWPIALWHWARQTQPPPPPSGCCSSLMSCSQGQCLSKAKDIRRSNYEPSLSCLV